MKKLPRKSYKNMRIISCLLLLLLAMNSQPHEYFENSTDSDVIFDQKVSDFTKTGELLPNERVVKNFSELRDALSNNNGITTVYFGADINMQVGGVAVNTQKKNIIINGMNPLDPNQTEPYTLTDYSSATFTDTVYVGAAGPQSIHVKNLNIVGKNYYGPFSIIDLVSLSDFVLTFEKVNYSGPQIGYHRRGLIKFIDCTVNIHGKNGGSLCQEFAEAKHLLFEGENTINTVSNLFSVFHHPNGGTFKVANDSSLNLISDTSTVYGVFYAIAPAYIIDITVGERGLFRIDMTDALAARATGSIGNLNVQQGGSFILNADKSPNEAVLSMSGNLKIEEAASFVVNGKGSASFALLDQRSGDILIEKDSKFFVVASGSYPSLINLNGGSFICNDPAGVLLHSKNRILKAVTSEARVYINSEQINFWATASQGGLDDPPDYRWKKAEQTNFWIDGRLMTEPVANFGTLSSNFEEGDGSTAPSPNVFSMINAHVIAFGRLELAASRPAANSKIISGVTEPNAAVRLSFSQDGIDYQLPDIVSDSEGVFHFNTDIPLKAGTVLFVKSNYQFLTANIEVVVMEVGVLQFSAPEKMEFFNAEINFNNAFVKRLDPDWNLIVSDTRGEGNEWFLYARLISPLTPSNKNRPVLKNSLVYANNFVSPLSSERLLIHHHVSDSDNDISKIYWPSDRGVLVQIPFNIAYSGLEYTAEIEWTLLDAP